MIVAAVGALSVLLLFSLVYSNEQSRRTNKYVSRMHISVPNGNAVWKFLSEIEYSSFDAFNDKQVRLAVDFENESWQIRNYFRFDERGKILLKENTGACLELVIYAFQQLEKDLRRDFAVQFAETVESSTFNNPYSRHWILILIRKSTGERYVLDPSFKRFGPIDYFDDYRIFRMYDKLPIELVQDGTNRLSAADGAPIFIKNGNLIGLMVRPINGAFDKDNFSLGIYAKKPFKYKGHHIYNIGVSNGEYFEQTDEKNAKEFLSPGQLRSLKTLLDKLYRDIES